MFNLTQGREGLPIYLVNRSDYTEWFSAQSEFICNWLTHSGFDGEGYRLLPGEDGNVASVIVAAEDASSIWALASVAVELPVGAYYLDGSTEQLTNNALGWVLSQYQFFALCQGQRIRHVDP